MKTVSLTIGFLVSCFLLADLQALAEDADTLVRQGEQLGRDGKFREALKAFHLAEKQSPKAIHDCYIAVAHMRLGELTAARYFLDQCKSRSRVAVPIEWYEAARAELAEKTADFGRLEVSSSVADVKVSLKPAIGIVVAAPVTLWVKPGRYEVLGSSVEAGVEPATSEVVANGMRSVRLNAVPTSTPRATEPMHSSSSNTTWGIASGVAGVLAGALGYYAQTKAYDARDRTEQPLSQEDYDAAVSDVRRNEAFAYSLYASAVAGVGASIYFLIFADDETAPVSVSGNSESVSLIWTGRF